MAGCNQSGLLIETVPPSTLLEAASIQAGDVILSVDGASVDRFSEVWVEQIQDRVHFDTFLARKPFFEELNLEVWRGDELKQFQVTYDATPELAVPQIPETVAFPPQFVSFGGVAMMNLTYNIVQSMINSRLAKYVDPRERETAAVVVVGIDAESPAGIDGSVSPGYLVTQVNGVAVQTIQQVCDEIQGQDGEWVTVHTDRGMIIFTKEEVDQHECTNQYTVPNQLCQWTCPEPEESPTDDTLASLQSLVPTDDEVDADATATTTAAATAEPPVGTKQQAKSVKKHAKKKATTKKHE